MDIAQIVQHFQSPNLKIQNFRIFWITYELNCDHVHAWFTQRLVDLGDDLPEVLAQRLHDDFGAVWALKT